MRYRISSFRRAPINRQILQGLGLLLVTFLAFWAVFTMLLHQIEIGRMTLEEEWHEAHYALAMSGALSELHATVSTAATERRAPDRAALERAAGSFRENLGRLSDFQRMQRKADPAIQAEEDQTLAEIREDFEKIEGALSAAAEGGGFSDYYFANLYPDFERLEHQIARFVASTEIEVSDAIATIGKAQSRFKRTLLAWVIALLFIVILFFVGFTAYFVLPIARLNRAVQRIARRDFKRRVHIDRNNELGELAEAINSMADGLEQFTSRIEGELERNQRLASLGRMAAGIAHEINNPLASIAACSEGLIRQWEQGGAGGGGRAQDLEYLKLIRGEVQRCKGITERLLGLSRDRPARFGPFDVGQVTRAVIELVRHSPGGREASIGLEAPEDPIYSRGDSNQIKQVLLNLLLNAIDAVKGGGKIEVRLESRKEWVRITITDTGVGMTAEELAQAFEPFFTTKEPGMGTGIGLTLSYAILKTHGGDLIASSEGRGRGSTFTIKLPRWQEKRGAGARTELVHAES